MKKVIRSLLWIVLGNLFYSLALNLFLVDNEIAAGGFAGIATLINHFVRVPVGTTVFLMNLPLILWAWKSRGGEFAVNCIVGNMIFTLITDLTAILPVVTYNRLAAAVAGGVIYGIGITTMVRCRAAAGGTDLLSRLLIGLKIFRKVSLGTMIMILDGAVVIAAAAVYGNLIQALYTLLGILVYSLTSDFLLRVLEKKDQRTKK